MLAHEDENCKHFLEAGSLRDFRGPRAKEKPEPPQEQGVDIEKIIGGGPSGQKYKLASKVGVPH